MALPGKVKQGDPVRASDWNAMIDCVRASQLSPGSGVRITRTPGGTTLAVDKAAIKTVNLPQLPFQVVQISSGDNPTIGVISDSHVINSANKDAYEEDNSDWGLLTDDETQGAFNLPDIGDKIWLQFTFDESQNLTSIDLKHGPVGAGEWDEFPDPISINTDGTPFQEYYHQIIAEATDRDSDPRDGFTATATDGTKVKIVQILNTNLTLVPAITTKDANEPNLNITVAIPSNAPATASDGSADPITDESNIKTPWEFGIQFDEVFPFKVQIRSAPDVSGTFDFGVVYDSLLLNSPDYTDNTAIEGLISGGDGWVTWNGSDDIVWLEIEWSKWPDSFTASIKSYSNGDDWGDGEIETDGDTPPTQTKARVVLASITSDNAGIPVIDQRVRTHLQLVGGMEQDSNTGVTFDCIVPAAFPAADALPEWMQGAGGFGGGYDVWFGDGTGSFVGESAAPIKCFELEVQDPNDSTASSMALLIGDDDGANNDMLSFSSGGDKTGNEILMQWVDYPKIELSNDSDAGMRLTVEDSNPTLLLADVWDDPASGNQIKLNIATGPELILQDDTGYTLSVNITDAPEVYLEGEGGASSDLSVAELYLFTDNDNNIDITPDGITRTKDGDSTDALFVADGTSEGDLIYWDGNSWTSLDLGASEGDLLIYSGGSWYALGVGGDSDVLMGGTDPTWSDLADAVNPIIDDSIDHIADYPAFTTAVKDIISAMSWTATCNSDGTITISAS